MPKNLYLLCSAIVAAALFLVAREHATQLVGIQFAGASMFAAPAPVIAVALTFPAIYLLWEQSDL